MLTATEPARPWQSTALPLAAAFLVSLSVVMLAVPPSPHSLTWPGVFSRSLQLLVLAALSTLSSLWVLHRSFRRHLGRPTSALLACAWGSAIWFPLLLLLHSQHALWIVLAPTPIAAIVSHFGKRESLRARQLELDLLLAEEGEPAPLHPASQLFASVAALRTHRIATPALAGALLLQAVLVAIASRHDAVAEMLVTATTAWIVWFATTAPPASQTSLPARQLSKQGASVLTCFLLTVLALTPFLRIGLQAAGLNSIVQANAFAPAAPVKIAPSNVYSGLILLAPPLPRKTLVQAPPRSLLGQNFALAKPLTIPFDGAYWYFNTPFTAPRPDAQRQRGDPSKLPVRSADYTPLNMEAHQHLGTHLATTCCRSLQVALLNADNRVGRINVELILRDITRDSTTARSLGTRVIRSSQVTEMPANRPPTDEILTFPIPADAQNFRFNEITLVFQVGNFRDRVGARVKVRNFVLVP